MLQGTDSPFRLEEEANEEVELAEIQETIKKMKKIVTLFRKSPVNDHTLQNHSREELGRELQLLRDCVTR